MPYLRHKPTGDLYPFNPHLATREDMEPVPDVVEPTPEPAQRATRRRKPAEVAAPIADNDDLLTGGAEE